MPEPERAVAKARDRTSRAERRVVDFGAVKGLQPARLGVAQYGVFEDAVSVGPTAYTLSLNSPRFLFVFPSYSITVLTLQP